MPRIRTMSENLPTNEPVNTYAYRTQSVILDSANAYIWVPQLAKEGDIGGRNLGVQVIDKGVIRDQSNLTLLLEWRHMQAGNSGQDTFTAVDAEHGLFEITYPNEMLLAGTVRCAIRLMYGDNERATVTRNFALTVETSPFDPEGLVVSNSFSTIQEILELWHHLPQYFQQAVEGMDRFKGSYISEEVLAEAWNDPAGTQGLAKDGDYAFIGTVEEDAQMWIWDTTDKIWVQSTAVPFSPESLKLMYESNEDTNAFTDAYKTKLDGIPTLGQPDWNNASDTLSGYIKNKPNIYQDGTNVKISNNNNLQVLSNTNPVSGVILTSNGELHVYDNSTDKWFVVDANSNLISMNMPMQMYTRTIDVKGPFSETSTQTYRVTRTGNICTAYGRYRMSQHANTENGAQPENERLPLGFRPSNEAVIWYVHRYGNDILGYSTHLPDGQAFCHMYETGQLLDVSVSGTWITTNLWPAE
jgi:hypothetical protein